MSVVSDLWDRVSGLVLPEPDLSEAEAKQRAATFMRTVAEPALQTVREELAAAGYDPTIEHHDGEVTLIVPADDSSGFWFKVQAEVFHKVAFAFPAFHGKKHRPRHVRVTLTSPSRVRRRRPSRLDRETLAEMCRTSARKWLHW
ncbi:hypothetical protein SAMN05216241_104189 [Limimonas halophila]|uniref:Uncharacterized protein n=1 Tax=Limimonas halophila TaxID=1082479 RepID=A0A1G7QY00_9PROT|nr:hypothetical protein [Limimonas halophila]SDG03375.1 hypothetical protein SAMN05216241_104189 [Limimonas halophila]